MKYLSVCSGVEAASQAWDALGWTPVAFSEIEPFPCAVLASRFPSVPNLGDMSKITYNRNTQTLSNGTTSLVSGIDLLVGGTPCQSFSIAGKRAGLEGASGLAYHFARLIGEIQPRWFVWENVPGALSSITYGNQRDFNFLLHQFAIGGDASLGVRWNLCWRILDTQYVRVEQYPFAIPQRRRRLFVVGHLATGSGSGCEVLLEQEGVRGDKPPRRVKRKGAAGDTAPCAGGADCTGGVDAINLALRGNRSEDERGKMIKTDFARSAYTLTGVQTDSMVAAQSVDFLASQSIDNCSDKHELAETCRRQNDGCGVGVALSYDGYNQSAHDEVAMTLRTATGGESSDSTVKVAVCVDFYNQSTGDASMTLAQASATDKNHIGGVVTAIGLDPSPRECLKHQHHECADTLKNGTCPGHHNAVAIGIGRDAFNSGANAQMAQSISEGVQPPMTAKGPGGYV